jgi:hypothetical protein
VVKVLIILLQQHQRKQWSEKQGSGLEPAIYRLRNGPFDIKKIL